MLSAALLDVTGVLGVGLVAGTGLVVLPYRKRQLQDQLHRLLGDMAARLARDLESHLQRAAGQSAAQLRTAVQPMAAFVESTGAALEDSRARLLAAAQQVERFQSALDNKV